jgi:hypothetical protein
VFVWEFVLDLVVVMRMTNDEKDLEIMLLRQQLRIVERKQKRGPQLPRWQKIPVCLKDLIWASFHTQISFRTIRA